MGSNRFELSTSRLSGARSNQLSYEPVKEVSWLPVPFGAGGDKGARTPDPLLAKQVLSQLSYTPERDPYEKETKGVILCHEKTFSFFLRSFIKELCP